MNLSDLFSAHSSDSKGQGFFEMQCWLKKIYRQGPHFHWFLRQLERSAQFSSTELGTYQDYRLRKMVRHCYRHVPYYTDLFNELKLKPSHFQGRGDLEKIPLLDKKMVNANFDKLVAQNRYNMLCSIGSTSGSTGTPCKFVRDFNAINFEHAAVWRQWRMAGDYSKKRVTLRGDIVVPASQFDPPFWKYNPANHELLMSSYHLSQSNSLAYIYKIMDFKPSVLYCGPSMGYVLAKFFEHYEIDYQFDAVFTSSESLEPDVRAYIERVFKTRIYDWYGQAERVAAIGQCQAGAYHIQEDYSYVELLGGPGTEQGQELVGTHLYNTVMPLLRYRTQDYVYMGNTAHSQTCECGSPFRTVEKIMGRSYGYLLTPEGYHIAITTHIPAGVDNIIETQFYQERQGEVILKVLTNGRFTEKDKDRLVKNALAHTSPHMKVIVKEVSDIPRGPNGKFINIINKMESLNSPCGTIEALNKLEALN